MRKFGSIRKRSALILCIALCVLVALVAVGCNSTQMSVFSVVFMNEGQVYETLTCEAGGAISFPDAPTKAADDAYTYEFAGWSTQDIGIVYGDDDIDADLYQAGAELLAQGKTTLYAVYRAHEIERSYTVVFKDEIDNRTIEEQTVPAGGNATPPTPPTHEGYTFDRWDGNYQNVSEYTTVTARYTANKYNLILHYLGEEHTVLTAYGSLLGDIKPEIADLELFEGWYTDPDCSEAIAQDAKMPASEYHLYAKFKFDAGELSLSLTGDQTYGNGDDIVHLMGLNRQTGLTYAFEWTGAEKIGDGETALIKAAGPHEVTCTVKISYAGSEQEEKTVQRTFDLGKATLTARVTLTKAAVTYGDAPEAEVEFGGFAYNDSATDVRSRFTYTAQGSEGPTEGNLHVGKYTVSIALQEELANYTLGEAETATLDVNPKGLKITASAADVTYGEDPAPTLAFEGFAFDDSEDDLELDGDRLIFKKVGGDDNAYKGKFVAATYTVQAGNFSSSDYTITTGEEARFEVKKREIALKVEAKQSSYVYGETPQWDVIKTKGEYADGEGLSAIETSVSYGEGLPGVGSHTLTLTATADNYDVTTENGAFDVTAKPIAVTVAINGEPAAEAKTFTYGDAIAASLQWGNFVGGESERDIFEETPAITFKKDGQAYEKKGNYFDIGAYTATVAAEGKHGNYDVTVEDASFEVNAKRLVATLTVNEEPAAGNFTYGDTITVTATWDGYAEGESAQNVFGTANEPAITFKKGAQAYEKSGKYFEVGAYAANIETEKALGNYEIVVNGTEFEVEPFEFTVGTTVIQSRDQEFSFAPTFGADEQRFEFKGTVKLLKNDDGTYIATDEASFAESFKWDNDGYQITLKDGGDDVTANFALQYNLNVTLNASQFTVTEPDETQKTVTYDGSEHKFGVEVQSHAGEAVSITTEYSVDGDDNYTATEPAYTDVCKHKIYYRISAENYEQYSGSYDIEIKQAKSEITVEGDKEGFTYNGGQGKEYALKATANFGAITAKCDKEGVNITTEGNSFKFTLVDAGTYNITFTVADDANYVGDTETVQIVVLKATNNEITIVGEHDGFTYNDQGKTFEITATAKFGKVTAVGTFNDGPLDVASDGDKFTFTAKNVGAYKVTFNVEGTENFNGATAEITVNVAKQTENKITVDGNKDGFTYDKAGHEFALTATATCGEVTATCDKDIAVNKEGGAFKFTLTNAGTYTITFKVEGNDNYADAEEIVTITVEKATYEGITHDEISATMKFGATLADLNEQLRENFRWETESEEIRVGENQYNAIYNEDADNYNDFTVQITVNAAKRKITILPKAEANFGALDAAIWTYEFKAADEGYTLTQEEKAYLADKVTPGELSGVTDTIGGTYLASATLTITANDYYESASSDSVEFIFKLKSVSWKDTMYTIEDALNAATDGDIIVKHDTAFASAKIAQTAGYQGAEYYTVKQGVTLKLPYDESGNTHTNIKNSDGRRDLSSFGDAAYKKLELTVSEGITIINEGTIIVGGITSGGNGGNKTMSGQTCSDYAQIVMGANAKIQSQGNINAYGFIVEAEKNNGSEVIMNEGALTIPFVVIEHRGGTIYKGMYSQGLLGAPFNRFYLENVTSKITVKDTASLLGWANLYASSHDNETDVKLIGNAGEFMVQLQSDSYVLAKADAATKVMTVDMYGNFNMNALSLTVAGVEINTSKTMFPISWYLNITLNATPEGGTASVDITKQDVKLLPGANVTIGKGVSVTAKNLFIADSSYQDVGLSATKYESSKGQANLFVEGTLTADTIGGLVQTKGETGKLVVNSGNIATTYEVLSNDGSTFGAEASWQAFTQSLKGKIYNDSAVSDAELLPIGTFTAKNGAWITDTSKFHVRYEFFLRDDGGSITPLQNAEIDVNNPMFYTHIGFTLNAASLKGYTFEGWFGDDGCSQSLEALDGKAYEDGTATVYGVFEALPDDTRCELVLNASGEGGTVYGDETATVFVEKGSLGKFVLPNAERQGYTFMGWYTGLEGAGDHIETLTEENFAEGSLTLYAKWDIISYDLTIKVGENTSLTVKVGETQYSTSTSEPISVPYGTTVTVTAATPASGYNNKFMVSSDPKGIIMKVGDSFIMSGNVTISTTTEAQPKGSSCVIEGTLITLADGTQKKVEDLLPTDQVLVFNHETGKYEACALWSNVHADNAADWFLVTYLKFSDGSELGISYEHALFDKTLNRYVYFNTSNAIEYLGHKFVTVRKVNGEYVSGEVTLVGFENKTEYLRLFSPVSLFHMNVVTNGLLSMTAWPTNSEGFENYFAYNEDMKFDEAAMQEDIEKYGLYTYEDFKGLMTEDLFNALPWKYFKIAVGKGMMTWNDILYTIDWIYTTGQIKLN